MPLPTITAAEVARAYPYASQGTPVGSYLLADLEVRTQARIDVRTLAGA